ncbi:GNAT family N-acetyltransferase [Bremerella sp.]|uniref:GNAT family N-acetyltransferase n=1 Tax=Bremerella sp. TaxID=2795602 RepID=UPI00391A40DC
MHVERFSDPQSLVSLRSAWNALAGNVPFRSYDWMMSWWKHYGDNHQLFVIGVFDDEELIGLAPWYKAAGKTGGRTLRFLGDGEVCSDYLDILVHPDDSKRAAPLVVDWLQEALTTTNAWDALEWENLEKGAPIAAELSQGMMQCQAMVHRLPGLNCWRLELPETWYDFEMQQSKSHRKQIRRQISRVLDTDRCQLHVCDSATSLDAAMPILIDLHMRRRKSLDQPGCFADDRFTKFLYEAASQMMTDGKCEILWLDLDEVPIAAEIHFPSHGIAYAYQAGIDPDRLSDEPGSLMQIAVIRRAIEQGNTAVDFLRGDEPYKAHWRAEPRACETIRIVPNTTFGLIRQGIWTTKTQVKSWLKASLGKNE